MSPIALPGSDAPANLALANPSSRWKLRAADADPPGLTHDLVESILIATAHFIQHRQKYKTPDPIGVTTTVANLPPSAKLSRHAERRAFARKTAPSAPLAQPTDATSATVMNSASSNQAGQLGRLALVTTDIRPVHRYLLPRLPHAWPPTKAVKNDRADALEQAHSLGLLNCWLASQPREHDKHPHASLLVLAIDANCVNILAWYRRHHPVEFSSTCKHEASKIQHKVLHAAVSKSNLIPMLDFWADKSGIDLAECGILPPTIAQDALKYAFLAQSATVLRWWGYHAHLLGKWDGSRAGGLWDFKWVKTAIQEGQFDVLHVCAELQKAGKVGFWVSESARKDEMPGAATAATESSLLAAAAAATFDPQLEVSRCSAVVITCLLDEASISGRVDVLDKWARLVQTSYTELAMDLAPTTEVLDWWARQSGLPLRYSTRAIHTATILRDTRVLDWWLAAFKSGLVPELKYDEWIMALASADWQVVARSGEVLAARSLDRLIPEDQVEVLEWWDRSGLDLKLPTAHDIADKGVPSPIDICLDAPVLHFWLRRAQRLATAAAGGGDNCPSPTLDLIQQHFPHYTHVAMHRAAYWNNAWALNWWFKAATRAGLPLRYSPHRIVELAAMSHPFADTIQSWPTALELLVKRLPEIRFRGSLLDWVKLEFDDAAHDNEEDQLPVALEMLERVCAPRGVDAVNGGGMPGGTDGVAMSASGKEEVGEEFVFFPAFFTS